jgi:uncharacterized protein YeaO (DUF488 family)
MAVKIKRIYEPAAKSDGHRVLVDRLWPRGIKREQAAIDEWTREVAPSQELRHWFGHDPERFDEFRRRYLDELQDHPEELQALRDRARKGTVTLLFGARDTEHNNAAVLAEVLHDSRASRA